MHSEIGHGSRIHYRRPLWKRKGSTCCCCCSSATSAAGARGRAAVGIIFVVAAFLGFAAYSSVVSRFISKSMIESVVVSTPFDPSSKVPKPTRISTTRSGVPSPSVPSHKSPKPARLETGLHAAISSSSDPSPESSDTARHSKSPSFIKPRPGPLPLPPFSCPATANHTCPPPPPPLPPLLDGADPSSPSCPEYFRWIHEDLKPWRQTGITLDMMERARRTANFRLTVVGGRAFVEWYRKSFQSRDVFTLWGILQLLRRYPGRVPDLDLMFDCVDWPVVKAAHYRPRRGGDGKGGKDPPHLAQPPLFRYCGDDSTLDIVFPDWSFWGWPEINIKPWGQLLEELKEGNRRMRWVDREPYAYWKGNPVVAATRQDLLKCNITEQQDWNARLFAQDWASESKQGFKESNLASQCNYRYKIYIEGSAWSVSEKYILACDSLALVVTPKYYDFYTRGLIPMQHYWPIDTDDKCRSIKFSVDWGNSHQKKAQSIGKEGSDFIMEKLKMDYVYDYMFHLLNEYSKLLKFRPTISSKAVEFCSDSMACHAKGLAKKFMMDSMVNASQVSDPCALPPAFNPVEMKAPQKRKKGIP